MEHCNEIATLVEAARRGDQWAWSQLFRRFQPLVWDQVLDRVPRYDQAADLVQETFLLAFRRIAQLREPSRFVGWLLIIARNRTSDWLSANEGGPLVPDLQEKVNLYELVDPRPGPDAVLERTEEYQKLQAQLRRMSTFDREVLEAFYYDRRSLKQIVGATGRPLGTVKRRLHHARRRLALISRRET